MRVLPSGGGPQHDPQRPGVRKRRRRARPDSEAALIAWSSSPTLDAVMSLSNEVYDALRGVTRTIGACRGASVLRATSGFGRSRDRGPVVALGAGVALAVTLCAGATARAAGTRAWETPADLQAWVDPVARATAGAGSVQVLREHGRAFLRLQGPLPPLLRSPGCPVADVPFCPELFHPRDYNAVRITLRHDMGWDHLGGWWYHARSDPARYERVPRFDPTEAPGDGIWHEVTLPFSASVWAEPTQPVVSIVLRPFVPRADPFVAPDPIPAGAHLDIARFELCRVPEQESPAPRITRMRPLAARSGREVTIEGDGFAEPATRNVVLIDETEEGFGWPAEVVSGDSRSLRVRIRGLYGESGLMPVLVRTPGGARAIAPERLHIYRGDVGYTPQLEGERRRAPAGSALTLPVRLAHQGQGLPDEEVTFAIESGEAALSAATTRTDEDGSAHAVLTLGESAGPVVVRVSGALVMGAYFVITPVPEGTAAPPRRSPRKASCTAAPAPNSASVDWR